MRLTRAAAVPVLSVVVLLAGCSSDREGTRVVPVPTVATSSPAPQGDVPSDRLTALLLQPEDLTGLPSRRPSASARLTTQGSPQLALCQAPVADAPHEVANQLAQSGGTPPLSVFQVVSVYADAAAATEEYDRAVAAARACPAFSAGGTAFTVSDLAEVPVPAPAAATHYRLAAPDTVSGDVRTLARDGRYLVLISGYGAPPAGQPLLDYQAALMQKAVARLR